MVLLFLSHKIVRLWPIVMPTELHAWMIRNPLVLSVCFFRGNLISLQSRKQRVVSRSSCESRYHAIAMGTAELL